MAVASLVCGILGLIGAWFPIIQYFTFILSILAIIFGVKARKQEPGGMATAGFVLGIIGVVCGVAGIICVVICAGVAFSTAAATLSSIPM